MICLKLCCDNCYLETFPQSFTVFKYLRKISSEVRFWKFWSSPRKIGAGTSFTLHLAQTVSLLAVRLAESEAGSCQKGKLLSATSNLSKSGTGFKS